MPKEKIEHIIKRLDSEVEKLIDQGVTTFISGGALGFEQLAASLAIAKKEMGRDIRLVFALPCKKQDVLWNAEQKKLYHNLLLEADETVYVSGGYTEFCLEKRNRYMIDHSSFCFCALLGGTNQTIRYVRQKGLNTINVAE